MSALFLGNLTCLAHYNTFLLSVRRDDGTTGRYTTDERNSVPHSLAIALGCQPSEPVHITDQEPMQELMRQNIALNVLEGRVRASVLDWGTSCNPQLQLPLVPDNNSSSSTSTPTTAQDERKDSSSHAPGTSATDDGEKKRYPDILLAADCVYFEPAFPLLQQTLRDLIGPQTTCYFCFKKRRRADAHFMTKVRKEFDVRSVADDPEGEVYGRESVFLFTIKRKVTMVDG